MKHVYGIDLGTTNSVIARLDGGRPQAVSIDGAFTVPSVVRYDAGEVVVGRAARNLYLQDPGKTVRSIKRRMGQAWSSEIDGRSVTPEGISAEILKALVRGAEAAHGEKVERAVVTVPAYFDDAQRKATLEAGRLAGLDIVRLLNEPTAAALLYEQIERETSADSEYVLVYDLGGGTFDVSVLEVASGIREVLATAGNTQLGGDDFDEIVYRLFTDHLKARHGVDVTGDPAAVARLRRRAEETKIELSRVVQTRVREEFLFEREGSPIHLELDVHRRQLEDGIRPLLESTIELTQRAIADARLEPGQLARVCLVGGSTRIPLVRTMLAETIEADLHAELDPDLAVGLGAAVQSAMLQGCTVDRILVDVAAHSLGIRVVGEEDMASLYSRGAADTFAAILPRNTAIPAARTEEFYTLRDDQEHVSVEVFQGESARASENTPLGSFDFPLEPAPAGSPVVVEFAYDLDGVVRVSVSQTDANREKSVSLRVADATTAAAPVSEPKLGSAIERRAAKLLQVLEGQAKHELEVLLGHHRNASGKQRAIAEDALLDFFIEHEAG